MFTYLVQTVNNMYQNVSGKSIENQELILRAVCSLIESDAIPAVLEITFLEVGKIKETQTVRQNHGVVFYQGWRAKVFIIIILQILTYESATTCALIGYIRGVRHYPKSRTRFRNHGDFEINFRFLFDFR